MSRWRAKGMVGLRIRCQASTALLSVLNSCESPTCRARDRARLRRRLLLWMLSATARLASVPAVARLRAREHCNRSMHNNAVSTKLTRGTRAAPLRGDPSTFFSAIRVSARTNRPFLLLGLGGTDTAQLLRENGKEARSRERQRRRRNLLPDRRAMGDGCSFTSRDERPPPENANHVYQSQEPRV